MMLNTRKSGVRQTLRQTISDRSASALTGDFYGNFNIERRVERVKVLLLF